MASNPKVSLKTGIIIIVLFTAIVAGLLFVFSTPPPINEAQLAEQWYEAVSNAQLHDAIKLAKQLVPYDDSIPDPDADYLKIAEKEKFPQAFFLWHFTHYDFKLWYDAWFLKSIAEKAKQKFDRNDPDYDKKVITELFETVTKNIAPKEKEYGVSPWPANVFVRKYGLCDRQSWLLAELLYQAGYDTQVVYLIDPETGDSPHTICEIMRTDSNGDPVFTTADPFSKKILHGTGIADLTKDDDLLLNFWPKREDWREALPQSIFWTPSYPQDYCISNQKLQKKLKGKLGALCPRFGEDPKSRLRAYHKSGKNRAFKNGLWFFPFRVLKTEMDSKKPKREKK